MKRGIPKTATEIHDPTTIEERRAVAGQCEESLQYGIRTYVDEMDDPVSKAYAAKPTRLYLVGVEWARRLRWRSGSLWIQPWYT
ncbi:MAG: hypothetical protein JJE12_01165 [Anaerolineales bacterium]|nr:hypothetical protein [Anaerolineales bacterium]